MISSVSDYEWVVGADVDDEHPHGDLDRITIDGGIMPKRPIETRNHFRGEDVIFLYEAFMRRFVSAGQVGVALEFSRKLLAGQLNAIVSLENILHGVWIDPKKNFYGIYGETIDEDERYDVDDPRRYVDLKIDDMPDPLQLVNTGDPIGVQLMGRAFELLGKCVRKIHSPERLSWQSTPADASGSVIPSPRPATLSAGTLFEFLYEASRDGDGVITTMYDYDLTIAPNGVILRLPLNEEMRKCTYTFVCVIKIVYQSTWTDADLNPHEERKDYFTYQLVSGIRLASFGATYDLYGISFNMNIDRWLELSRISRRRIGSGETSRTTQIRIGFYSIGGWIDMYGDIIV